MFLFFFDNENKTNNKTSDARGHRKPVIATVSVVSLQPVEREPLIYHLDASSSRHSQAFDNLTDEFFEVTVDDIRKRFAQLKSERCVRSQVCVYFCVCRSKGLRGWFTRATQRRLFAADNVQLICSLSEAGCAELRTRLDTLINEPPTGTDSPARDVSAFPAWMWPPSAMCAARVCKQGHRFRGVRPSDCKKMLLKTANGRHVSLPLSNQGRAHVLSS